MGIFVYQLGEMLFLLKCFRNFKTVALEKQLYLETCFEYLQVKLACANFHCLSWFYIYQIVNQHLVQSKESSSMMPNIKIKNKTTLNLYYKIEYLNLKRYLQRSAFCWGWSSFRKFMIHRC